MSSSEERGRIAEGVALSHERQIELAKILNEKGYSNSAIAHIMRISENSVRTLLETSEPINWGYNCLTRDVHHGRPEAIWNIPLLYAVQIYHREMLHDLVIARIHGDALQFTLQHEEYTTEWAKRVRACALERYDRTLQHTVDELSNYYKSSMFEHDSDDTVRRFAEGKLNPGYQPLHGHDSINMLCRIIGTSASREASRENHGT